MNAGHERVRPTPRRLLGRIPSTQNKRTESTEGRGALADPLDPDPLRPPLLLGMGEAAKYLGVSRPTLWRMIQAGTLEKVELFPGSHRVRRLDLEDLAMRREGRTPWSRRPMIPRQLSSFWLRCWLRRPSRGLPG